MKKLTILIILIVVGLNVQSQQLHDYNPSNYNISDNCTSAQSDLKLSGAPSDAAINGVNLYFEINHPKHSDLKVWITAYYSNTWHDVILYNQGSLNSTGLLKISKTNITTWNGASPNQTWYLVVKDCVSGNIGFISFFELWVNYNIPPELDVYEEVKDFGEVAQGDNPSTRTFTFAIYNDGGGTLSGNISSNVSWLTVSPGSFSLSENAGRQITVTATTSGLAVGDYTSKITVTSNGGNTSWTAAKVTVVAPDPPKLDVYEEVKDFGEVAQGDNPSTRTFTFAIYNDGGGTLSGNISSNVSWLTVSPGSFSLSENAGRQITVTATTSGLAVGDYTSKITVTSNGGNTSWTAAKVTIVAPDPPKLDVYEEVKDFGEVAQGDNPSTRTFTFAIYNDGGGTLSGNISSNVSWLTVSPGSFSLSENAGRQITVTATTSGLAVGDYTSKITVTSNGGNTSWTAAKVTIVAPDPPKLDVYEEVKDFGEVAQGDNPSTRTFTFAIYNDGGGTLSGNISSNVSWLTVSPGSFSLSENAGRQITVTATTSGLAVGDYTSKITVTSNGGNTSWTAAKVTVVAPDPPKLDVYEEVKDFGEVAQGDNPSTRTFTFAIYNDGGGTLSGNISSNVSWLTVSPGSFSLSENAGRQITVTATTSGLAVGDYTSKITVTSNGGNTSWTAAKVTVVAPDPPKLDVYEEVKDFGEVAQGDNPSTRTFTFAIYNDGGGTLSGNISSNVSWLTVSPGSFSLSENAGRQITVTATTSGLAVGDYTSKITVTSNGGNTSWTAAKVTVVAPDPPKLDVYEEVKDFGEVAQGDNPSTRTFTFAIYNDGGGTLSGNISSNVSWLTVSPGSFSLSENAGRQITVTATTSGLAVGDYTSKITVTSNGGNTSWTAAKVTIVAPDPPKLDVYEEVKDFGEVAQGDNPSTRTFTFAIYNDGGGTLSGNISSNVSWLTVSPGSFSLSENAGRQITVTATTSGLAAGDYTSKITVTSNGGNTSWQCAKITVLPNKPVFTFVDNSKLFGASTIYKNSTAYIYGYVEQVDSPPVGTTINFNINSDNINIPAGIEYLGDGILKLWLDLNENINKSNLQISLPSTISQNGTEINFKNIPPAFNVQVQNAPINQSIDIFAGGSAGVKLIAGGVGAGPSIAAASLSLNGTGGMGMSFYQDSDGNELISRRFEAGIGLSVQSPAINAVVGDITAGVNTSISTKGILGQTLKFPIGLNDETKQKAKAAYILETFAMGGVELSPFASVFLAALNNSLVNTNPDLEAIYSDLYYSNNSGVALEGEVSVGFSVALTEGKKQDKIDLMDVGGYFALTRQRFLNIHDDNQEFKLNYAKGKDLSLIDFKIKGYSLGNFINYKKGNELIVNAKFNPIDGINFFKLSYGASNSEINALTGSYYKTQNYEFIIPKNIIDKNQNSDNIIGSMASKFYPELPYNRIKVGSTYIAENLNEISQDNPQKLDNYGDHILMQNLISSVRGYEVDAKIDLDAVLGIGGGLSLGINYSYLDKMSYRKNTSILAHDQILPVAEYATILDENRLFSLRDEINDIFQGTVSLIKGQLIELVNVIENQIESNLAFVIKVINGEVELAELRGTFSESGLKWITRTSNPTTKSVQKSAFLEPKVIIAYSSRRIIHQNNKSASLINEEDESVLYIVSENINVSLVNSNNQVINEFEPVTLSVTIDSGKMSELGFGEEEKKLAKLYQYDAENLVWIELSGDSNSHLDTVSTQITNSASYAIGIELNSINDNTAPDIQNYYPKNEDEISPVTNFWAKLYESPTGVGIDFSQTVIKIDNLEVEAVWNPIENIISFESVDSLSIGQHTFEVIAKDYNGNTNSVKSIFIVSNLTGINSLDKIVRFNCYPVPMHDILNIEINSKSSTTISVSIYNQIGQLVSSTFECQPVNGYIKVQWDRTGMNYQRIKSGIYFVRIKQDDNIIVKKIVLE